MVPVADWLWIGDYTYFLIKGAQLTVGVVYRCPSTSKEQDIILHNVISHVSRIDCVIMADFNHADIKWNSLESCDEGKAFFYISSRLLPYTTCIGTYERR